MSGSIILMTIHCTTADAKQVRFELRHCADTSMQLAVVRPHDNVVVGTKQYPDIDQATLSLLEMVGAVEDGLTIAALLGSLRDPSPLP